MSSILVNSSARATADGPSLAEHLELALDLGDVVSAVGFLAASTDAERTALPRGLVERLRADADPHVAHAVAQTLDRREAR